jgi:hypothetical protein
LTFAHQKLLQLSCSTIFSQVNRISLTTVKNIQFLILISAILFSCAPRIKSTIKSPQPPLTNELAVVLKPGSELPVDAIEIGTISSGDNGFSTHCSYDEIIGTLKERARKSGANILKITEHKLPNGHTTCDRIKAKLYRVTDPKQYEKEIEWSATRKLTWDDFKGATTLTDLTSRTAASTYGKISFRTNYINLFIKGKAFVRATFLCDSSWVKPFVKGNKDVLLHEQTHFDITELYTRRLRKQFAEFKISVFNMQKANNMFTNNYLDYYHRQHQFDYESEHGLDTAKEKVWEETIKKELNELEAFAK